MPRLVELLCLFCLAHSVYADVIPFKAFTRSSPPPGLRRRDNLSLKNLFNSIYVSNITLGGIIYPVLLDTGSSDLWVTGSMPGSQDSGKSLKLDYAIGTAQGNIHYANLTIGQKTVQNQAFLLVQNTSSFSTDITTQGYSGLLGLGPNTGSNVRHALDRSDFGGDSPLSRIFQLNATDQNYITLLLDRTNPPNNVTGQFTIGELARGYESIAKQPKLNVVTVPGLTDRDQHWQMYTDVNAVIGPDGQPIVIKSIVPKAPKGKLVALIDSGFTLPQVPRSVSDAIYGRVQGAQWNDANHVWTIPCGQMLNISFNFGGVNLPIHPLDASMSDFNLRDSAGNPVCVGTFQPITSAFSLLGEYDLILGMAFLRNAYTLIDFGNFVKGTSKDTNAPFVQMLPLTNPTTAQKDFVQARMNGVDNTRSPSFQLLPTNQMQHSPESAEEIKQHREELVLSRWPYILFGSLVGVFALVGFCIWRCCRRRRLRRAAKAAKGGNVVDAKRLSMIPLQKPEGGGAYHEIEELPMRPSPTHAPSYYSEHSTTYGSYSNHAYSNAYDGYSGYNGQYSQHV